MPRSANCTTVPRWDFAEIIVTMPIAPVPDTSLMHMLVGYLVQRFPEEDIEVVPTGTDAAREFQVIPMAAVVGPGNRVAPLEMPTPERLDEINQAVCEFRKAAKRQDRNIRREDDDHVQDDQRRGNPAAGICA